MTEPSKPAAPATSGRYAYEGLQRAIHEKARLGIMTSLVSHPLGLTFNDLKALCSLTDGNLSRHLEVLREAGLISVEKEHDRSRRQTLCRVTPAGQREFLAYLGELQRVVADAAAGAAQVARAPASRKGWSTA